MFNVAPQVGAAVGKTNELQADYLDNKIKANLLALEQTQSTLAGDAALTSYVINIHISRGFSRFTNIFPN